MFCYDFIFFQISHHTNENYTTVIAALRIIDEPGKSYPLIVDDIDSLLTQNKREYFTVTGSLTTPPCSQAVVWVLFRTPIPISRLQVSDKKEYQSTVN